MSLSQPLVSLPFQVVSLWQALLFLTLWRPLGAMPSQRPPLGTVPSRLHVFGRHHNPRVSDRHWDACLLRLQTFEKHHYIPNSVKVTIPQSVKAIRDFATLQSASLWQASPSVSDGYSDGCLWRLQFFGKHRNPGVFDGWMPAVFHAESKSKLAFAFCAKDGNHLMVINCLCPSLCRGHVRTRHVCDFESSQSDRHFVWLAMANMHVMYHTWRACSPSLSESWLAGRPRAALFSKWSTFRVISDGEHARYLSYITCIFATAKWKLPCWAATCSFFSKWSTFRVISDGEHARYVSYITCIFATAKWKLACWACSSFLKVIDISCD